MTRWNEVRAGVGSQVWSPLSRCSLARPGHLLAPGFPSVTWGAVSAPGQCWGQAGWRGSTLWPEQRAAPTQPRTWLLAPSPGPRLSFSWLKTCKLDVAQFAAGPLGLVSVLY